MIRPIAEPHSPTAPAVWRADGGPLTRLLQLQPSGAHQLPAAKHYDAALGSVCGFCSTGCGLEIFQRDGRAVGLAPADSYPVNQGTACPKGWEALAALQAGDRAVAPLIRQASGKLVPCDWDAALRQFCDRLQAIQARHGAESVAFLSTGQIPTEEMALLGCLAKFGMGMVHGDGNTRQCMATSVVAYKQSFGFDAPPYSYEDFEQSDVIFLVGSNLCIAHPILWQRVLQNPHRPEIIVVDPRRTETAMAATLHLPLRPKSDLELFYGLAHVLIREGWIDQGYIERHTVGFVDFAAHVQAHTPAATAQATGLPVGTIERVAELIHRGRRVSFWWTMGVNQSYQGVRTAQSLIDLALMTGNMGRPGTGANSITGQCNAMGSRLFSNTTNLLGGRDFANAEHRQQVADVLGIDAARIPDRPSWAYDQIIEGILQDKIKGLWIIATNPAHSWINQHMLRDVLGRLEFLVVQDMYHSTETAQQADLVLPAAGWGEKAGTFINSERRIGLIQQASRAPGAAMSDFRIFRLIAQYWGCGEMFARWTDPEAVFRLLQDLSRGQPCDMSGIQGYAMLAQRGGVQWPYPAHGADDATQRRLFADGRYFHADGKARFLFEAPREMPEAPAGRYPLLLLTGRGSAAQWHTQTRTGKSSVLRSLAPGEVYVEINPVDARARGVKPHQRVVVESQRGVVLAKAVVTYGVQAGQVFMPMHYHTVNRLTLAHFDPYSRQPSYKNCAVNVRPHESSDRP